MNAHRIPLSTVAVIVAVVCTACHPTLRGGGGGEGGGDVAGGSGGAAPVNRRVLGLGLDTATSTWSTVQVDPDTGMLSTLAALSPEPIALAQGTGTFDHVSNRIFEIGGDNTLLVIDGATGVLNSVTPLVLGAYSDVMNLEANNAGELIGLAWDANALHFDVVRIDVISGALFSLASLPSEHGSLTLGTGTFAPLSNQIFQTTGENALLVIDAASGALNSAQPLVLGNYPGVMNLETNNAGELIGLAFDTITLHFDVVRIDVTSGAVVSLSTLPPQDAGLALGMGTFDPVSNRMFELTGDHELLVIDGATGALNAATPILLGNYNGVMNLEAVP